MTPHQRALSALDEYLAAAPDTWTGRGRPRSDAQMERERKALRELADALNERES